MSSDEFEEEIDRISKEADDNLKKEARDEFKEEIGRIIKEADDNLKEDLGKLNIIITVDTFLGGLLLFGITGSVYKNPNEEQTLVIEMQVLAFFCFFGAINSAFVFLLFTKFKDWAYYEPCTRILAKLGVSVGPKMVNFPSASITAKGTTDKVISKGKLINSGDQLSLLVTPSLIDEFKGYFKSALTQVFIDQGKFSEGKSTAVEVTSITMKKIDSYENTSVGIIQYEIYFYETDDIPRYPATEFSDEEERRDAEITERINQKYNFDSTLNIYLQSISEEVNTKYSSSSTNGITVNLKRLEQTETTHLLNVSTVSIEGQFSVTNLGKLSNSLMFYVVGYFKVAILQELGLSVGSPITVVIKNKKNNIEDGDVRYKSVTYTIVTYGDNWGIANKAASSLVKTLSQSSTMASIVSSVCTAAKLDAARIGHPHFVAGMHPVAGMVFVCTFLDSIEIMHNAYNKPIKEDVLAAVRKEGSRRENLRRWAKLLTLTMTAASVGLLCVVVWFGAKLAVKWKTNTNGVGETEVETEYREWTLVLGLILAFFPPTVAAGVIIYFTHRLFI